MSFLGGELWPGGLLRDLTISKRKFSVIVSGGTFWFDMNWYYEEVIFFPIKLE